LYELPDGAVIELSKQLVYSPSEILFRDNAANKSLTEMIETSLERCTHELRQEVMKNAIFCGGSSMLKGL
jgi:actin-related protein